MSNHDSASLRGLGNYIKDLLNNYGNAILDFDWNPIMNPTFDLINETFFTLAQIGVFVLFFIWFPWNIFKWIMKDIDNWKSYHIGQKIMHPITNLIAICFISLAFWIAFLAT